MTIVADTSVVVKWFVQEDGHVDALRLLENPEHRICPDLALVETANALRRKLRMNEITANQMSQAITRLPDYFTEIAPSKSLLSHACSLAALLDHSVYDCMFLALALQRDNAAVVTADMKFVTKCVERGFAEKVGLVSNKPIRFVISDEKARELVGLVEKFQVTLKFVESSLRGMNVASGGSLSLGDIGPAYDSPLYQKLIKAVSSLTPEEARIVVAISWFGRGHDFGNFEDQYGKAPIVADKPAENAVYIAGILQHFELGLEQLRITNPQLFIE